MSTGTDPIGRMTPYGPEHLTVLVGTVVLAIVLVMLGWTAWGMFPSNWNIDQSLPLHYSDALRVITSVALITRAGWAISISYFWGLTLNLQSVITPDLNYFDYPILEFIMYWFLHIVALLVPIIFVWGLGYRPTWRGFAVAYAAVLLWAGIASVGNALTGANYGYLSHEPAGASILDVLGPWPVYIFWEAVIIAVVWALMTLPWQTRASRTAPIVDRWATVRRRS